MNSKSDHLQNSQNPIPNNELRDDHTQPDQQLSSTKLDSHNNRSVSFEHKQIRPKKLQLLTPFIANRIKVEGLDVFGYGAIAYHERSDLIIFGTKDNMVRFSDVATGKEQRSPLQLPSFMTGIAYSSEADTCVFGCADGELYTYNMSEDQLIERPKRSSQSIIQITFLNREWLGFIYARYQRFYIRSFKEIPIDYVYETNYSKSDVCSIESQRICIEVMKNSLYVYPINQLPRFPALCSNKAHGGQLVKKIRINKSDYVIIFQYDVMKIFQVRKGRVVLLKAIQTEAQEFVCCMAYLEEHKMIAVACENYVRFFGILSGKLEQTLHVKNLYPSNMFLMKDGSSIGITDESNNIIKIIQLPFVESDE